MPSAIRAAEAGWVCQLRVAFDSGAIRILLPLASLRDIPTISGELFAKFQTPLYSDPVDPVFKAWSKCLE